MSTVVVTGAAGGVGRWVVDRLVEAGWDVIGVDLDRPAGDRIPFYEADLADQGAAWELVLDADPEAVVHLAAVPSVGIAPGTETFRNNVQSAYNVLVAGGVAGAKLVWTSSETVYGTTFAEDPWLPDYLPLDEDHDRRPEDPYAASKLVGEEVAEMVSRRYGVPAASIRPVGIHRPGEYRTRAAREAFDPETAPPSGSFWSYVDVRDVASIVEAALDTGFGGHEAFLAATAENYLDRPTAAVVERTFGALPDDCDLDGDESAFSTAKAEAVLGWSPEHSWRTAENETVPEPSFR